MDEHVKNQWLEFIFTTIPHKYRPNCCVHLILMTIALQTQLTVSSDQSPQISITQRSGSEKLVVERIICELVSKSGKNKCIL